MSEQNASSGTWLDSVIRGVGAAIDSQYGTAYQGSVPGYNTAGGYGGQPQATNPAQALAQSPVVWVVGAAVVVLVLVLALKR